MSRRRLPHSWECRGCEWPHTSALPARYYDQLCASCDPRTEDERAEYRRSLMDEIAPRRVGAAEAAGA